MSTLRDGRRFVKPAVLPFRPVKTVDEIGWADFDNRPEVTIHKGRTHKTYHLIALLSAFGEVAAAMNAVLDADIEFDEDSCWLKDVDGIRYFAEWFVSVLVGDAHGEVKDAADAELARRVEAHERGAYHYCPVFWGGCAIRRARETVRAILDRDYGPGEKPCIIEWDVRYQGWALEFLEGAYDNEDHLHISDAAKKAYMDALFARIAAG